MFECVLNVSEGRDIDVIEDLARHAGASLRDTHHDPVHHRSVFTLINANNDLTNDVHALIRRAMDTLTLTHHDGVHPRLGVVDVVPFVALDPRQRAEARRLRDDTARWVAATFDVATFLYGELEGGHVRSLPEIRRGAFTSLTPDFGPAAASPRWGAVAVGERPILVAWNLWLEATPARARALANAVRSEDVRALGFDMGDQVQVSCNLVHVARTTPSMVYDLVASLLRDGERIARSELVGLIPATLLEREPVARWSQLDLSRDATVEARVGS